jgi:hypothetical protein
MTSYERFNKVARIMTVALQRLIVEALEFHFACANQVTAKPGSPLNGILLPCSDL